MQKVYEKSLVKKKGERYQMNGMLLNDETVIYGMEHEPTGKFIPVTCDKNGEFKGSIVTQEQMEKIRGKLDSLIAEMGNALHSGKIDDMPYTTGSFSACDYCDFKAVCSNRGKRNEVSIPKFEEALQELEGGEEHE